MFQQQTLTTSDLNCCNYFQGDFNIFVTDWGKGAITIDYDFAVATTRVVAAQLAKFIRLLVDENGLDLGRLHLIGSSLGAQISGNAGSKVPGIARITGKYKYKIGLSCRPFAVQAPSPFV